MKVVITKEELYPHFVVDAKADCRFIGKHDLIVDVDDAKAAEWLRISSEYFAIQSEMSDIYEHPEVRRVATKTGKAVEIWSLNPL